MVSILRVLRKLFGWMLVAALLMAAVFAWWVNRPLSITSPIDFTVPQGSSATGVARAASASGVPLLALPFTALARLTGQAGVLKAGTYQLTPPLSPWQLLDKLVRGDVMRFSLMVPEGWTFRQMRVAVESDPNLRITLAGASDTEVLRAIGAAEAHPEGLFFPDTYTFARGSSDVAVYRRAYRAQQQLLEKLWAQRVPDLPLRSAYDALILASIIEKETGRADERNRIAGVFINRLRAGMPLQTDPTVIYGMGGRFDGNIRKDDLQRDTPYNTYQRRGLPPTPIALPGRAALDAALRPEETPALYFVARGDGSSEFSNDLNAHNRAVNRWQRGISEKGASVKKGPP